MRKENNIGLQQSSHIIRFLIDIMRQYEIMDGNRRIVLFKPSLQTQKRQENEKWFPLLNKLPIKLLSKHLNQRITDYIIMENISPFTPSSAPWAKHDDHGIIGPNSSNTSSSSFLSTSPAVSTLVWQSNNSAPRKSERSRKKQLKDVTGYVKCKQPALFYLILELYHAAINRMRKRYADTVATGNGAK
ncbi:17185_t:CDS:2, partial [Funneliformis geosporum]